MIQNHKSNNSTRKRLN